jgi:cysteine desulfurase / selenocysteine lyase
MPITRRFAYFDHAAVGPLSGPAAQAVAKYAAEASTLGDTVWPDWNANLTRLRRAAAQLMDADTSEIAIVPNTTTGINFVAEGYPWQPGDNVVLPEGEFPSNLFPWQNQQSRGVEVRIVPRRDGHRVEVQDLIDATDSSTRIIACSWVGYATGFRIDLDDLVSKAHAKGVLVFVDAIQGLGMYPLSIKKTPIDFLSADGHKWMLGPEGIGVAMIRQEHLEKLRIGNVGWGSSKYPFNYTDPKFELREEASRYESGSANMVGAAALLASIELFLNASQKLGPEAIADRVLETSNQLVDRLRSLGARIQRSEHRKHQSGIVTFAFDAIEPTEIRARGLASGVVTSCRGGGVRAAVHAYNDQTDLDRLIAVVKTFL